MTIPEVVAEIHELNLEDHRISSKSIAEHMGISRERVGSIVHDDVDMRKLCGKWIPKCLSTDQKRQRCQSSEQIFEFFQRDPNDFLSRLMTCTKPAYITMSRIQRNNQGTGGIAAHPAPNFSKCKNPLENFSPPFFGFKTASSTLIVF
jgi:hypothetical protein